MKKNLIKPHVLAYEETPTCYENHKGDLSIYKIPSKNIKFKIGQIDPDDYIRFIEAYNQYMLSMS